MADSTMEPKELDLTVAAQLAEFEDPPSGHRQHFPATDLIRTLLIYHISATTELSTHIHLSRQVVLRCTQAFEAIHRLMTVSSQPGIPLNWDLFDAYTRGIPILESVLLSFETADPYTPQKNLPNDDDDLLSALRFIFLWDQERTQLVEALKRLAADEFLGLWKAIEDSEVDADAKELLLNTRSLLQSTPFLEIARDDVTTLTILWEFFDRFSSELILYDAVPKGIVADILHEIHGVSLALRSRSLVDQNSKDNIQQAFLSPHYAFAQIFIKSLMLITVPFSLLSNKRSKPLDDNSKKHLAQEEIWNAIQRLAKVLAEAVNDENKRNDLKDAYAYLRKLLLSNLPESNDPLVDEMLQLLRLSAQIFRRFQQRSVALIRLLHFLDQESSTKSAPSLDRDTRGEVRKVFQVTIGLLKVTEEKFRGRSLRASVTDEEYNERATAFEKVFAELRQCGKILDPSNLWLSKEADFVAAVELDETHMKEQAQFQLG